ncbi:MAG: c-type cytochrome [Chloroflexota bacterium]
MRRELLACIVVVAVLLVLPVGLFAAQSRHLEVAGVRVIELQGRSPAEGGWQPEVVRLNKGERVRLRLSSLDVVHGLAVPGLGIEVEEIAPGRVVEVEFTADRAGRFPFACTRWCSADHWRMRGTIEISNPAGVAGERTRPTAPAYVQLKVDLDAPRPPVPAPSERPTAPDSGALLSTALPEASDRNWLNSKSPAQVFTKLRALPWLGTMSDAAVWDLVAAAWASKDAPDLRARGQQLYSRDCAACHGEQGRGDGPAGRDLPGRAALRPAEPKGPIDFADSTRLLSASDVLLQGKALRGGMGTGMPEWGSLYSDDELWAVVAHLRTFQFDYAP